MLNTKKDFQECLTGMIEPLKKFYSTGKAAMKCGATGVQYGEETALLEAFARPLWGLAPLWAGNGDIEDFKQIYLEGMINGTDPEHREYWGRLKDQEQKLVETAPIGLLLILAPNTIWDFLTDKQKNNVIEWLYEINHVQCTYNNWCFFPVLVNLGLKSVGAKYDKEVIKKSLESIDSYYVGNGWYTDGKTNQIDHYIGFAFHFYGLIYAKVMEKDDPEHSRIFKDRAMLFAKDFIYWFADDGAALPFGRSLTYRFAQCCFWSACVFADIEPFPMGVMKGIISRCIEYWMNLPIFDNGGVLTIGYAYPNLNMSEGYNAFGSPYWALKSFLVLALKEDHEFFKIKPAPLPQLEALHVIKEANMVIQRIGGYVTALTAGQWVEWEPVHTAEKYSKFAYSTKYGFSVPRSYHGIANADTDSMLTFVKDGVCLVRRKCDEYDIGDDGMIYSKWQPCCGILVETYISPTEKGHIRKHIIHSKEKCVAFDCAFATPNDEGDLMGDGEKTEIICTPNTNLIHNLTKIKAIRYEINTGENIIETVVVYPGA